jgi:hypothetical protein
MRRPRRAAAAYLTGITPILMLALVQSGVVGVQAALAPGFPASRIKLDPAVQAVNISNAGAPGLAALSASLVTFSGAPLQNVSVTFSVLYGPDTALRPLTATTDRNGKAAFSFANSGGPGTDVVQATFLDANEVHRSNRPDVTWLSGPPVTAIPSPAAITLSPPCFQPATAAAATSDVINPLLSRPPAPSRTLQPTATPVIPTYTINVDGVNFNPFSSVLITFDVGPGGKPESFQTRTDGFGHFNADILPTQREEGLHVIRADDFKQREAQATYTIPCFQPSLALDPPTGPPGFVPFVVGTGFPANGQVVVLRWTPGLTIPGLPVKLLTDGNGAFRVPVLVMYHDILGPRQLQAIVPNPYGPNAGAAVEAEAPFLVTLGRAQPSDFVYRR